MNRDPSKALFKPTDNNGNVRGKEVKPTLIETNARVKNSNSNNENSNSKQKQTAEYPVSLYDTQNRKYESFANSVRQRNDTFYFVSFRRVNFRKEAIIVNFGQKLLKKL